MNDTEHDNASDNRQIVVAVTTYRRPLQLQSLLPLLLEHAVSSPLATEVVVVDNDPEAGARSTVDAVGGLIRYVHEPVPGISAARNRALDEASGARAVIFVDDDQRPDEKWLDTLVRHWQESTATAVKGAVVYAFDTPLDPWIVAGRFFDDCRTPTGAHLPEAGTANLLLDLKWIDSHVLRFNDKFGLTGGEDTLFTQQLVRLGGTIERNDDAVVLELVPSARTTPQWVLRRSLREGNTWSRVVLQMAESPAERLYWRLRAASGGLARLGLGGIRAAAGTAFRSISHQSRGLKTATRGIGMLLGACGCVYREYRRNTTEGAPRATGV